MTLALNVNRVLKLSVATLIQYLSLIRFIPIPGARITYDAHDLILFLNPGFVSMAVCTRFSVMFGSDGDLSSSQRVVGMS
jgi:hypothetical protein